MEKRAGMDALAEEVNEQDILAEENETISGAQAITS